MQKRKTALQGHRMRAFAATLSVIESQLENRLNYLVAYREVYQLPKRLTQRNVRDYKRWIKSVKNLKDLERKHIH